MGKNRSAFIHCIEINVSRERDAVSYVKVQNGPLLIKHTFTSGCFHKHAKMYSSIRTVLIQKGLALGHQ